MNRLIGAMMTALSALAILAGCGEEGPQRVDLSGKVTWKGQPVSRGVVIFDSDVKKGNRGPQGAALILDGRYDTRNERSKGCLPGPHIVTVQGFDGVNINNLNPFGGQLFQPFELEVNVPEGGGELDLVVPDTVAAASAEAVNQ